MYGMSVCMHVYMHISLFVCRRVYGMSAVICQSVVGAPQDSVRVCAVIHQPAGLQSFRTERNNRAEELSLRCFWFDSFAWELGE